MIKVSLPVNVPIVKRFSAKNPVKTGSKYGSFFGKNGDLIIRFWFQDPNGTSLSRIASFDVFCVKISVGASAVASLKNQKTK